MKQESGFDSIQVVVVVVAIQSSRWDLRWSTVNENVRVVYKIFGRSRIVELSCYISCKYIIHK